MKAQFLISLVAYYVIGVNSFNFWKIGPSTVSEIDLNAYAGQWYQTYASLIPNRTFEKNAYCVTAHYTVLNFNSLSIINSENFGSPTGLLKKANGTAIQPDADDPGKLVISFQNDGTGSYWIIKLGPLNAKSQYDYAVVSTPLKLSLYILVRDVDVFTSTYEEDLLKFVADRGFTSFYNAPLKTYQGNDCAYNI